MIRTVGELRKALDGISSDCPIVVRVNVDEDGEDYVDFAGALLSAQEEEHHERYFALDCGKPEGCPSCGAEEVEAPIGSPSPRTVYACGSSDYDQRPGTFTKRCGAPTLAVVPDEADDG